MDRRSTVLGALAGAAIAAGLLSLPSPFRSAAADGTTTPIPFPLPPANPPAPGPGSVDPVSPTTPGRTINPDAGSRERATPNPGGGTSGANNHAIALSGSIGSGESVVYYFDTDHQRLLVYQYKPGDRGGISLVAARHIDYDLKLEDYRDRSEKTHDQLKSMYDASVAAAGAPKEDLPVKKVEIPGGK
jgi:hypothetical protein